MPDSSVTDDAAKSRIIKHMNADHQDSLVRYLEHFSYLPPSLARHARIVDISLDSLTLVSSGIRTVIPLDPPMANWSEARERMVKMDKAAIAGLGRSDITIKEYAPPAGRGAVIFVLCLTTLLVFRTRRNFEPGSWLYENLLANFPAVCSFFHTIQPWVLYPMFLLHAVEAVHFERTRLRHHSVPRWSRLWWLYVLTHFVEGVTSFWRFDRLVERKKAEKLKEKH
ncbi:hypothetical protein GP486_006760 [Trichoglossum hirsutum]|uniref:DUF2470 domain-containing protein n=1 Tax=Trichoglossum hirsutum TaxID=265104 RepID=A0A9P8IIW2_9PEZI|nr:hypothetical protein GP486_006760 [Trichoglossum hirsutum]